MMHLNRRSVARGVSEPIREVMAKIRKMVDELAVGQLIRRLDIGLSLDRADPDFRDPIDVLDDVVGEVNEMRGHTNGAGKLRRRIAVQALRAWR
jgi:hypothetical protein